MNLCTREAVPDDFTAWLQLETACFGFDGDTPAGGATEWGLLFLTDAALTLVIEDIDVPTGPRLVGVAGAVFVSDEFVAWFRQGQPPCLNRHAAHPPTECSPAILNGAGVDRANASSGLNGLVTHWVWDTVHYSPVDSLYIRTLLMDRFLELHAGFNVRQILIETVGTEGYERCSAVGFDLLNDYSKWFTNHPKPNPEMHPYVFEAVRERILGKDGAAICRPFLYTPPRFGFDRDDQALLLHARQGLSDEELAEALFISLAAVKKRWTNIYRRVSDIDNKLLPYQTAGVRGTEKRRRLMRYLRDHPEELRAYAPRPPAAPVWPSRLGARSTTTKP
ncbi:MAG: response regulator transcription factor [Armatimonadetes bacterium]|nr:response regulator transcription factor [Armatimonadota bacterium]MDE2207976.1 response regulator transcription factor [Armatimonadota bacterium]